MKPDAFMRMYWNEFWQAVQGLDNDTIIAYLRTISFYYHHNHCAGLKDDDDFLRRICAADKSEWSKIRDIIFDNDRFFAQDENGLWNQKRAQEEWVKAVADYDAAVAGGKNRWKSVNKAERSKFASRAAKFRWKNNAS